jgi:hypothetical protein
MHEDTVRWLRYALIAAAAVWGGFVTIMYLGVPVHLAVLVSDAARSGIIQNCASSETFCTGLNAFFPFLANSLVRLESHFWYGLILLLVLGGRLLWHWSIRGTWKLTMQIAPWHILVATLACVWLTFTTLSFGDNGKYPFRQLFEPLPQVYVNASPVALQLLQRDFNNLKDRGCISQIGMTGNGAGVFELSNTCIQISFFTRVVPHILLVLGLLFEFLIIGRFVLERLRLKSPSVITEAFLSAAVGACGLIALLWTLAVIGVFTQVAGWAVLLAIPVLLYRQVLYWFEQFIRPQGSITVGFTVEMLLWVFLLSYIALNFLTVIRPFPIGWDDLGSYLNRPKLLVSYGYFIPALATFQWEYVTSLGFLLFGYDSPFGASSAMMINWMQGLLALAGAGVMARTFAGRGGVLAALLYYTLPMVGHFSYADMKIDNAAFMAATAATIAAFLALFPADHEDMHHVDWKWMSVAGALAGFAFGIKVTTLMVTLALGAVIAGAHLGISAFLGASLLALTVLTRQDTLNINQIVQRILERPVDVPVTAIIGVMIIVGAGFIAYAAHVRRAHVVPFMRSVGLFVAGFAVAILPWVIHNNILNGNTIPRLELSAPPAQPVLDPAPAPGVQNLGKTKDGRLIRALPPDLAVDLENPACKPTGSREELDRYWGFTGGISHYLTLPWRTTMNIDSAGYYVTTMPALLLFPLVFLLPAFWDRRGKWLRWLTCGTLLILIEWMFVASGIVWYGVGMFLGFTVGLAALLAYTHDAASRWIIGILLTCSLLMNLQMRMWQEDQQKNLLEYAYGEVSADALQERTIPHYDDVAEIVKKRQATMPNQPYTYRVGTFIPYFIPRNIEVLPLADNQLDFFTCIDQERDPVKTLARLKALGFNGMIFDTNTHTIERDPNGSLHKKVDELLGFLNSEQVDIQPVVNDPQNGIIYVIFP